MGAGTLTVRTPSGYTAVLSTPGATINGDIGGPFDGSLDRFSAAVIYTALTALAEEPALWSRYANGENLLFKRADFDDPPASPLFADLLVLANVRQLAERLQALCRAEYAALPALKDFVEMLLEQSKAGQRP